MNETTTLSEIEVNTINPEMARHIGYLDGWMAHHFKNPFLQTKVISVEHAKEYDEGYCVGRIERKTLAAPYQNTNTNCHEHL